MYDILFDVAPHVYMFPVLLVAHGKTGLGMCCFCDDPEVESGRHLCNAGVRTLPYLLELLPTVNTP